jgi:hypothetical protein
MRRTSLAVILSLAAAAPAFAGGAWVPEPGSGWVQLGASRKTAQQTWSSRGTTNFNAADHDFRYAYLSGETGLWKGLAANWNLTYLDGYEGRPATLRRNKGASDAWLGLEYGFRQKTAMPLSVGVQVRTPALYDEDGPYCGGECPEWRGLLKHDYSLLFSGSRSFGDGGWANVETGYTWREGAPADQFPLSVDVGVPLPWSRLYAKATGVYVQSLGNDTVRRPDDRFGSRPGFNFNNASMARVGASLMFAIDAERQWWIEAGYNQWVWGKSARQYDEPYVSFARSF